MRVITFNLRNFTDDHWEQRLPLIINGLKRYSADVLCFQEVRGYCEAGKGPNMAEQIQEALPAYKFLYIEKAMDYNTSAGKVWEGLAILSRQQPGESGYFHLPLGKGSDSNKRILIWAHYIDEAGSVYITNNHFSYDENQAYQNAIDSYNHLKNFKGRILFVGDLNAEPNSKAIQYLVKNRCWLDIWSTKYPRDKGYTFRSDIPTKRIDYQFSNVDLGWKRVQIERVFTGPDSSDLYPSDHFGVMTTIK